MTPDPSSSKVPSRLPGLAGAPLLGVMVVVMAAGTAGISLLVQWATGWPGLSFLSSVGHGLAFALLAVIVLSYWTCKRERRSPNIDPQEVDRLRAEANRRWTFLFLLAWAIVPVGLVAALWQLPSPPSPVSPDFWPYLPLGIAILEAVVVVVSLYLVDAHWQGFLDELSSPSQTTASKPELRPAPTNGQSHVSPAGTPEPEPEPIPAEVWPVDGPEPEPETKDYHWPTAR
jgi:hypothetical protein